LQTFSKSAESATRIGGIIAEIATASGEQANGIGPLNRAVAEMGKVVQQNAADAEESATASHELSVQAIQMGKFIEELVSMVGRGGLQNGGSSFNSGNGKAVHQGISE
jgi:methyl-accepting chemotaxis protein